MSRNGKVVVAMSGGVDSSVAASMLRDQGYDCIGVFLRVGAAAAEAETCEVPDPNQPPRRLKHGCCSATDALDARAIAGRLDIPFYALNFEKDFNEIIDYFVDEYAHARTPNPCVMCNIHVKFGKLLRYADMMDAEFIATGHYARVLPRDAFADAAAEIVGATQQEHFLARSRNPAKDQSYVLFGIRRENLGRCLFPLGDVTDKTQVRQAAADLGLRVHDKPDSQEICFVPDQNYRRLVGEKRPEALTPGDIVDADGNVVGQHEGIASFTIGQRRGLGIAAGHPLYVTRLNVLDNTAVVGPREDLLSGGLLADQMNWLVDPAPAAARGTIKIRHMHTPAVGGFVDAGDGTVRATFDEPQLSVTPGQAAVLYVDDLVCGGGWIRERVATSDE